MTKRERVLAASRGGEVDQKPTLSWLTPDDGADATVLSNLATSSRSESDGFRLAEVSNPFGLALERGIDLNQAMRDDPSSGGEILDDLVAAVRLKIESGLQDGADGVFYRLHGATPKHCSPMQYGGYYLEADRELLADASDAALNVLFVAGGEDVYIDFVSDLPAHVFAWDSRLSGITAAQVRSTRHGAVASEDPTSEFSLIIGDKNYLTNLEQANIG